MQVNYATLVDMQRLNNSNMGNPNYSVTLKLGDGTPVTLRSSANSSWCYALGGHWLGKSVTYHTTKAGRIDMIHPTTLHDTFVDPILTTREA